MGTVKRRCGCVGRCTHSWQATYRKPDGREQTKSFKRQVDAEAWLAGMELTKHRGDWIDPANARRLFGDVARKWRENHIAAVSTLQKLDNDLEKHVYPTFEKKPIGAIARSDVQAWVKGRSLELSPSTVEVIYRYVSTIFRSAVDDGIIAKSPCVNIKLPAIVRPPVMPLTTDQVGAVIEALPARFKGLALVSAGAGLRPGEARGLTLPWFNFLKRELRVEQQLWTPQTGPSYMIRPKRGSVGTIPIGDAVVTGLAKHFEEFPPSTRILCVSGQEEVLVFTDDKGHPIRRQRWNEIWNRAATAAALSAGDNSPRPSALLRQPADRQGHLRQGRPDDAPAQDGYRDLEHVRPSVARGQRPGSPSGRCRAQGGRRTRFDGTGRGHFADIRF